MEIASRDRDSTLRLPYAWSLYFKIELWVIKFKDDVECGQFLAANMSERLDSGRKNKSTLMLAHPPIIACKILA